MFLKTMIDGMLRAALLAGTLSGVAAERPYEIVRAGRTADEFPPVARLERADGWRVACADAEARFETAADRALFGPSVTRLSYRGTGPNPVIRLTPPAPIAVPDGSDTVSLWVWGNNVFGNSEYDPPYEKIPCVRILANFADPKGRTACQHVGFVYHKDWHLLVGVVTNGVGGRAALPAGSVFTGLTVTGGVNRAWQAIDLTSLGVFRDPQRPSAVRPRAKRGVQVFADAPQGLNTGDGRLPFPTRAETVIPPAVELPAKLEFQLPKDVSDWSDLKFRYAGSPWIPLARGGGVLPRALPAGAKVTFRRVANSLVCDVVSPTPGVTAVLFGSFGAPADDIAFIAWPYYTLRYYNPVWDPAIPDGYSRHYRPRTAMVRLGGRTLFVGATFDWTQSNASNLYYPPANDVTNRLNSGVLYEPKTDGRLNGCFERFVWTFSEDVTDVLPAIPNPVSPHRAVAGSHSWAVCGARDHATDAAYWRAVKKAGIDRVVINDHETEWRDDNESFTFRTESAPRKGGDPAQIAYTRTLIDELGFRYGPYNNFTDYAPVNAFWSIDNVTRRGDGQLKPGWNRCYAPKPTWAVGMCEYLAPIIKRKFGFNTAYCDVHTAVTPWGATDFDARAPGAGTFAQVFYAYGEIMLLQKAAWGGPVYSEGGIQWLYSGLTDGNYAQDSLYDFEEQPWLVDFDLRRIHPLCCNFGMGTPWMFYGRHGSELAKRDRQAFLDRFTAATLAFGHPGFLVSNRKPDDLSDERESYFPVQAIAARYTLARARTVCYAAADGSLHTVSAALANGAAQRSQLKITYDDGTVVAVNGNWRENFRVEVGGVVYDLPPNGWRAETADKTVVSFNGFENRRRVRYARSPDYNWRQEPGPTGREWEDPTALHAGKEKPCAAFASFATVEEAKKIRSEFCPRRVCLDSETEWRFHYCTKPELRPVDFYRPSFDVSGWDVVKVPCSWQAMGINGAGKPYGHPFYTNANWPFVDKFPATSNCWPKVRGHKLPACFAVRDGENPVGSYRRDFDVPADWAGDEVFLEFGAVDSFFYLWVNGRYVGFSKSSRDPARFNVTKFVNGGRNTVALEVYRFSDASYLEAQDMLLMSGITRSVWLFHTPKTHIRDVMFSTRPVKKGDYAGAWKLELVTDVVGGAAEVVPHVFGADGQEIKVKVRGKGEERMAALSIDVASPRLWSAECPNLYTLVLELRRGGRTLEAAGFQLGFREVEIRDAANQCDRVFLFNGQPIKMRGANRHESSPLYGHYTPDELIELDVRQLKQANCNHVRNSHYPQPDYFYYLCNKYGIYVMDEANVESHGFGYGPASISHEPVWEAAHVDRVMNMVERNKCHPSVVIWSLGNEAGPGSNFVSCVRAIKARDLTRPVQYERNNWITDMGSRQYPTVQWVWDCANAKPGLHHEPPSRPLRYPFHINEYAHNMGNAMGNLKDYQDAIESTTRIMGAAIWDWVDQGIWKTVEKAGGETTRILAYGGDWGELPNCGSFMMNGCVLADRTPEPGYWEIKHVFQPIVAVRDGDGIRVTNRHYFRDLSAYNCVLTHLVDGETVSEETVGFDLAPRDSKTMAVADPTGSYRVSFRQKADEGLWPKGWTIADDQIDFTAPAPAKTEPSGKLAFGFSEISGELVSLKSGRLFQTELLKEPLTLDIWRAPVENEPREKGIWNQKGFANPAKRLVSFADGTDARGVRTVRSVVEYALTGGTTRWRHIADTFFRVTTVWTIRDGAAKVKATFEQIGAPVEPAHIGFRTVFANPSLKVDWLGCGPWENYSDRKSGAFLGHWSLASEDFFFPYDVPQDCGNREGTYRVKLAAGPCTDVTFETLGAPFAFEVNPYAPETLVRYRHPAELPASEETFFGIYAKSRGLGGNSCGPLPLARDIVADGLYELEFVVR